jgi:methylthioribose-1-phosphate isomerase
MMAAASAAARGVLPMGRAVAWDDERGAVRLIEQRNLPVSVDFFTCTTVEARARRAG